jgi:hypothetical protein
MSAVRKDVPNVLNPPADYRGQVNPAKRHQPYRPRAKPSCIFRCEADSWLGRLGGLLLPGSHGFGRADFSDPGLVFRFRYATIEGRISGSGSG